VLRSNWVLEKIILPVSDQLNKSPFYKKLKEWRQITIGDKDFLEKLQKEKLKALLSQASKNSPFYSLLNIPEKEDAHQWLRSFPVLKKKTFKDNLNHFLTVPLSDQLISILSSGSSGPPSQVYFNKEELASNRALQILWWEWAGYRFGNSVLQTGVNMRRSKEKRIKDFLLKTRYIDAMSHSDSEILRELRYLEKYPKDHFVAYSSSLFLFAKTAFKSVISLGEKLLPSFRQTIEKAFHCKVYDTYGASEGFLIASQCMAGNYHVMNPHLVLEILDDKGNEVSPGETGRVVLTGLDNFTTPLIRYEVGDLATKSIKSSCECGLQLPLLGEIIGRQTEFILTPGGKYITVQNVVRIMKQFPEIEQFKVVQDKPDFIRLIYIPDANAENIDESRIKEKFEEVFFEPVQLKFESVKKLPKAKTGKFQLIERNC
jgi:phenylacetate-CoA ligase